MPVPKKEKPNHNKATGELTSKQRSRSLPNVLNVELLLDLIRFVPIAVITRESKLLVKKKPKGRKRKKKNKRRRRRVN